MSGDRLLTHNVIVGIGTFAAGGLGVAFQSIASHELRPGDYGAVFAVVTILTFIGLPAGAFTLLMARETSRRSAIGLHAESATLLRHGNHAILLFGLAIAGALALGSPWLSKFLDLPFELLVAAAVGVPCSLALPLLMGEFQGEQRFVEYAALSTGQAALKLSAAVGLGLVLGPLGVIAGISVATIVIYFVAAGMLRRRLSIRANLAWLRPAAAYLVVALPSTLALAVLLSADVLLVKHYFTSKAAGEYAAMAALGRAIFWGASGVAIVLFPKMTARAAEGRSAVRLVGASLSLVAVGGVAGFTVLWLASRWLLTAFAGGAYEDAAMYLPTYAIGMVLLGGVAVLTATQQSRGEHTFLAILLPLSVVEPGLIAVFHRSVMQVIQVLDVSMLLTLAGLTILYASQERSGSRNATVDVGAASLVPAPQFQGNQ